jgi:hypothetical protein
MRSLIFGEISSHALTAPIIVLTFLKYFCSPMEFAQVFDMLEVALLTWRDRSKQS